MADKSVIERERIRRRVAAALKGEEYSVIEMAYDLERLATHPVWEQADRCASELEGAVEQIAELGRLLHQANVEREDWKRWCLDHEAEVGRLRAALGER